MSADKDVTPLLVIAIEALCAELRVDPDDMPPGAKGVLLRFGLACHARGKTAGRTEAHTARTVPPPPPPPKKKTDPRFPGVPPHPTTVVHYDDDKTPVTHLPDGVLERSKRGKNPR